MSHNTIKLLHLPNIIIIKINIVCHTTHHLGFFNSLRNVFPLTDLGISLINFTPPFNCLCSATFPFTKSSTSCSLSSSLLLTTNARGSSPDLSSSTPCTVTLLTSSGSCDPLTYNCHIRDVWMLEEKSLQFCWCYLETFHFDQLLQSISYIEEIVLIIVTLNK